jgi:rhodanese-related sulfurtransferase
MTAQLREALREGLLGLAARCAVIVAVACVVAVGVNAARLGGLPLLPGEVPCPGVSRVLWGRFENAEPSEARRLWQEASAAFVDARPHEEYIFNHVPGAVNLPYRKFSSSFAENESLLAPTGVVVIYGDGKPCGDHLRVAKLLAARGFTKIKLLHGGYPAWEAGGYPVQGGHTRGQMGVAP